MPTIVDPTQWIEELFLRSGDRVSELLKPLTAAPVDPFGRLCATVGAVWPAHREYLAALRAALSPRELVHANWLSDAIMTISPDLVHVCEDYQWLCEVMRDEQLQFMRTHQYRLSSFSEVLRAVYENAPFMTRYLNGLLVGRVLWLEQLRMLVQYADEFLPGNRPGYRHLEIGPGHGILLYLAAQDVRCSELAALDVSASSLQATNECLQRLQARASARLIEHDIFCGVPETSGGWNSIVVSELLEHLEAPDLALRNLAKAMNRDGRMFISTPVNCPMPDHIYLFKTPEEVGRLVESCGLKVIEQRSYLSLGHTEAGARKHRYPIACTLIAVPTH